ncbi:MAG: hypothetical protein Q8L64_05555 [bacterium]|nr:hypothetical protein [bacterium]
MPTAEDAGPSRTVTRTFLRDLAKEISVKGRKPFMAFVKKQHAQEVLIKKGFKEVNESIGSLEGEVEKTRAEASAATEAVGTLQATLEAKIDEKIDGAVKEIKASIGASRDTNSQENAVTCACVEKNKSRPFWPWFIGLSSVMLACTFVIVVIGSLSGSRVVTSVEKGLVSLKKDIGTILVEQSEVADGRANATIEAVNRSKDEIIGKIDDVHAAAVEIETTSASTAEDAAKARGLFAEFLELFKRPDPPVPVAQPEPAPKVEPEPAPAPAVEQPKPVPAPVPVVEPAPVHSGRVFADADRLMGKRQELVYGPGDNVNPRWFSKRAVDQGRVIIDDPRGVYVTMDFSPWFARKPIISEPIEMHLSTVIIDGVPTTVINLPEDVQKAQFWLPRPRADGKPLRIVYVR